MLNRVLPKPTSQAGAFNSQHSMSQAIVAASAASPDVAAVLDGMSSSLYLPDSAALRAAGVQSWGFCPDDVQSMLLQRMSPDAGVVDQGLSSDGSSAQIVSMTHASPGAEVVPKMLGLRHLCSHAPATV